MEDIRWPTTITSPKTIVTKPKQKDRFHQWLLPPKPPQVCFIFKCVVYIVVSGSTFQYLLYLLLWEYLQVWSCQRVYHFKRKPTKHWSDKQKLLQASDNMNSYVFFFLFFFLSVLWWEEKKKSSGHYWLLLVSCECFYSHWWFLVIDSQACEAWFFNGPI